MKTLRNKWHRSVVTVIIASRHEAKKTQEQLAAQLKWHPSRISKIEIYERRIDVGEFIEIAIALDLGPVELLIRVLSWEGSIQSSPMMKTFTATEWKDLARGCRLLAAKDQGDAEPMAESTVASLLQKAKEAHLKLAERCEEFAKLASE